MLSLLAVADKTEEFYSTGVAEQVPPRIRAKHSLLFTIHSAVPIAHAVRGPPAGDTDLRLCSSHFVLR